MTLRERWSDWNREPFTSDSRDTRLGLGEDGVAVADVPDLGSARGEAA